MKNIHVLPTDKLTKISISKKTNAMVYNKDKHDTLAWFINQNIYITSDGDINENDYIITKDGRLVEVSYLLSKDIEGGSKVVLTTDQDLIKDGVQSIDDEFLKWFVKNPNCEESEVKLKCCGAFYGCSKCKSTDYKIIIPKKEPKQEYQSECICDSKCRGFVNVKCKKSKQESLEDASLRYHQTAYGNLIKELTEQESLEEAAHRMLSDYGIKSMGQSIGVLEVKKLMVNFAKQQERMYSEEEVRNIANWAFGFYRRNDLSDSELGDEFNRLLAEKFKKK